MTRKLFLNTNELKSDTIEKYGKLILTLSLLEWFLQEVIILIILKRKFDPTQKSDLVLANQIFESTFNKKLSIVKKFELLSDSLNNDLDTIRKRRNVFVHGIGLKKDDIFYLEILGKQGLEIFDNENIDKFKNFVEDAGGRLVTEFENKGFSLEGTWKKLT